VKHAASVRPEPGSNSPRVRLARSSNRCHHAVAHDSVSESLNCLFGSSSPCRPEQTPDQRARLAHPDSQIDCQIAVLCRSRRQPLTVSTTKQPVNPINRQTTTGLDTARKV